MAFDTLIKKFFPAIIAALVALIAYLQASGAVELIAQKALAVDPAELTAGSLRPRNKNVTGVARPRRSGQPIIDHNIFEHDVDLNPPPPEPDEEPGSVEPPKLDLSDPLSAPFCEDFAVDVVTQSTDATWSIAVVQAPGEDKGMLRRVGDTSGEYEVVYIGFNRVHASPAVWLTKEVELCQALLFPPPEVEKARKEVEPKAPVAKPAASAKRPTAKRGPPTVPKEIADKIEKVSDTDFNVDRAVIDNILENQATLMRSARIVPEKGPDGKTVGIRMFGIRKDTLLGTLGLNNGDRLETINGFNLASPEDALNAYARLRTANKLAVKITRRGKPMTIDFNIK